MLKEKLKRLERLEKHMDATTVDEKAIAEFCAWIDAHPSKEPVDSNSFDFHAWIAHIPPEHKKGFSHWLGHILDEADGKSKDLVHH